jgi:rhodanese-related sulfurtransferase
VVTATATAAPTAVRTAALPYWETRLYSDAGTAGRGWGAPVYDGVDDQLADARSRLARVTRSRLARVSARAAYQDVLHHRAVLVDIRPAAQRAVEGEVAAHLAPLVVERNVLEWRFDPRHEARLPQAAADLRVLVLCQEGYTSSLAADALLRIGVRRATDVVGGFRAWKEAGLPTA